MKKKLKLPDQLEAILQAYLRSASFDPWQYKQETLIKHIPKEEFKRDWTQYESHCRREKFMFFKILKYAVDYLNIKYNYKGNGRPLVFINDIIKSLCIRDYSNYSSWRCESELKIAKSMGIIKEVYKRSTLLKYLQSKTITNYLHQLYKLIADPIAPIETHFSADATGIKQKYGGKRWVEVRNEPKQWRDYRKLHIISGAKTNIITSAKITAGNKHESPFLKELLEDSHKRFNIKEFSADAGYLSKKNVKAISKIGAIPFIKPKKNTSIPSSKGITSAWGRMLKLWKENQDLFSLHYNQRQNVEATFGMMKKKLGDSCRAKLSESQENEILCKIVCHNAIILARAMIDFNLDVKFMAS